MLESCNVKNHALNELLLFEPHNMLISGITGCGKTMFILDLIEKYYYKEYNYIIIFCPTFFINKTYDERDWIYNDNGVIIIPPSAVKKDLDSVLEFVTETYSGTHTLFIIDDCANLGDTKKKVSELCNLAFSGRHHNITVCVINQKYNSIVKDFRENIKVLILFCNKDKRAMKQALEENDIIPEEKRREVIESLNNKKGSKLILRLEPPCDYLVV